ncbi:Fibronectin type III domain protein [Cellulomonas flavigena DSM 20109]|uniref:Fibronectin type III domain protein n=1 Tax=Cellulomonas flavigena (strain ATCC 482 / DSM 20109 / BCRC 11376 / JCM 18109 / NBRC 3775 / NCIMB 8073 / NRS 134) TaxID=446466 RepID=D5UG66_CELFN|nr:fibronectin type III domain-containing protein [Cellulomonas flavigena]ADG75089.1 Fibronectin type III domain protein [Cellulomonas flavigena DSM 20109]
MTWWDARTWRRGPASRAAAIVTVPAVVLSLALLDQGFPLARVDLNDGGVWLTATSKMSLGRYNVPVEELDGGLVTTGGTFDVLQDEGWVLLREQSTVSVVDPASVATTTQLATPGTEVSMAAGRVAFVDSDGDAWVRQVAALDTLDLTQDTPDLRLGAGGVAVVARSGAVLALAPETGTVTRAPAQEPVAPEEVGRLGAVEADAATTVGDELVVLSGSTVRTLAGTVEVDDDDLVLQQPGPAASSVLVAGRSALWEVPLDGGAPREHPTTGSGRPAKPVRVGDCAYAAWSSSVGGYLELCAGRDAVVKDLEGLSTGDQLEFRVNRGLVVLNDTVGGRVWLPQEDTEVRVPNWDDIVPEEEPEESEEDSDSGEVMQEPVTECSDQGAPPVAADDAFGVRAGRTRLLPVIDNDSSADCKILVITQVDAPPPEFGTVEPVRGGRALQVHVAEGASGSVQFKYSVNDGGGVNAPATGVVTLTVSDGDTAPTQARTSTLTVETGGQLEHGVLADFHDADGDDLLLVGATADPSVGTARFRQDGVLTFTADGGGLGRTTVQVQVSDGTNVVDGEVVVDVRAAGSVAPQIDPVHAVTYVGQEVVVSPLDAVRSASSEPPRLAAVSDVVGATIVPDLRAGTFTFKAPRAQVYYVQFVVTAAPQQATGLARIDVREWPEQAQPPIAVRDLALLPAGGEVTVDPLANDEDPADNVLVLQTVTAPEGSGLQVAVIDHRYVRIRAERTPDGPVPLVYEVSNGSASARGEIVVHPIPPSASSQAPVVPPVEASVRAGGVVTIPVLAGASDPDGDPLTVLRELSEPLPEGDGLLFVSGDVLRYQAPNRALTARATFQVQDTAGNVTGATVTVRVHESDPQTKSPPRPKDVEARVFEGDVVRIPVPLVGIDDDGDGVTLLGPASAPALGRITEVGPDWLEYEADRGSRGTEKFTYAVEDWVGQRAVASVRVGIAPRPSGAAGLVAVDDAVTLRPGQRVEVRVLANDIDSTGRELSLEAIEPPEGLDAQIQGRRIVVTAPPAPGVVQIPYLATNDGGGSDYGVLTVTVTPDAPVQPPRARDVLVPAIDTLGKTEVSVDVLAVAQNPSGPLSDLEVSVPASHADVARVTEEGDVVVTLVDHAQTVPYRLVNTTEPTADAYAFITVPALGFFPPQLRPRAPELRVASGEQIEIPLAEHVQVAPGRKPTIADPTQVSAPRSNGAELVKDPSTIVFTSAEGYAGPASVTVPVTDATGPSDTTARTALLTLQITVYAVDDVAPTFDGATIEVEPGEAPTRIDLLALTHGPEQADGAVASADRYGYSLTSVVPAGFVVDSEGSELWVSADPTTPKGTTGRLDLRLTYGRSGAMEIAVDLRVVASKRRTATVQNFTVDDGAQGRESTVDVLEGAFNPFPDTGPLKVVGAVVETVGAGTASASSSSVTVRPGDDFIGLMVVRFRVRDVTSDPGREVEGRVTVRVSGVPLAPVPPRIGEVRDRTVVLSWTAPDNRGEPITEYRVTAQPGGATRSCASTTCTIDNLTNDVEYTFTVEARNRVGWSEPSPASAPARPDAVPDAPGAPRLVFGDGSVTATWDAPVSKGSPITSYSLEISPAPDSGAATRTTTSTSYTFDRLRNGVAYTVRVRAHNKAPEPSAWSLWSGTEIPAGPPGAPTGLAATRVDVPYGGQITVTWGDTAPNGDAIQGYELVVGGSNGGTFPLNADARSYAFAQARNGETYTFSLRARNKAGWGSAASTDASTYGQPGAPGAPSAEALVGQGAARLTWADADGNGAPIERYVVTVSDGRRLDVSGTSTTVTGLTGGSSYTFTVTAVNAQGEGPASAAATVQASTPPGTPTVEAPVVSATGDFGRATQLLVSWSAVSANALDAEGRPSTVSYEYQVTSNWGSTQRLSTTATSATVDVSGWRFPVGGGDVTVTVWPHTTVSGQRLDGSSGARTASVGRWGSPPSAPGTPTLVVDGTALTASWTAPAVNGGSDIERYQVTWTIPGRRDRVENTGPGTLQHTNEVGDVPPGTVVTVTVRAENASGRGDPASATWTVPEPAAPEGDG